MSASPPSIRHHRPFVLFWCARLCANLALQMQTVAVGWQMYELTGSTLSLGLVGLAQFTPAVLLFLITGHVADRFDRRSIVRISQLAEATGVGVLALATAFGGMSSGLILAMVAVTGAARAFEAPTIQALLPGIVPPDMFARAVPAASAANQFATITGPALGGLLYLASPTLVYAGCTTLFLAAALCVSLIPVARAAARREPVSAVVLFAGIDFIRRQPVVLGAISLDLFAVLLGGATALLPVFARDIFATGPWGLGLLRLSPAVGALLMSIVLARHPIHRRAGAIMLTAVACFGVATVLFALSHSLVLAMAALVVLGASDMVSVVVRQTLVQLATPDAMRGRVSAVNSMFVGTSNQLGEFELGLAAYWLGTIPAVLLGGLGTLAVVAIWAWLFPQLRRADALTVRPPHDEDRPSSPESA